MYRAAMRSIFSELVRSESLIIVDDFSIEGPKTKNMIDALAGWKVGSDSLLVGVENEDNVSLSSRNIPNCEYIELAKLNPVSLVSHDSVVMTSSAVSKVQEWLS